MEIGKNIGTVKELIDVLQKVENPESKTIGSEFCNITGVSEFKTSYVDISSGFPVEDMLKDITEYIIAQYFIVKEEYPKLLKEKLIEKVVEKVINTY